MNHSLSAFILKISLLFTPISICVAQTSSLQTSNLTAISSHLMSEKKFELEEIEQQLNHLKQMMQYEINQKNFLATKLQSINLVDPTQITLNESNQPVIGNHSNSIPLGPQNKPRSSLEYKIIQNEILIAEENIKNLQHDLKIAETIKNGIDLEIDELASQISEQKKQTKISQLKSKLRHTEQELASYLNNYCESTKLDEFNGNNIHDTIKAPLHNLQYFHTLPWHSISVNSNFDNAEVIIDGISYGLTPIDTMIPAGIHNVIVQKTGYNTFNSSVNIQKNKTIKANLVPIN